MGPREHDAEDPAARDGRPLRVRHAALGLAGPLGLLLALAATGVLDHRAAMRHTISAVTAEGSHGGWLRWAQVAFATGLVGLAPVLHRRLPGPSAAGPLALAISGAAGLVVVGFGCGIDCMADGLSVGETVHIGAAVVGGATLGLAPLLLARRLRDVPGWDRYRRACLAAGVLTGAGMLIWAVAAGSPWEGAAERFAIAVPAAWAGATGVRVLRGRVPSTRTPAAWNRGSGPGSCPGHVRPSPGAAPAVEPTTGTEK